MAYYLQMDGVDDCFISADLTFDSVVLDAVVESDGANADIVHFRSTTALNHNLQLIGSNFRFQNVTVSIDGVNIAYNSSATSHLNTRRTYRVTPSSGAITNEPTYNRIFIHYSSSTLNAAKGKIYSVKYYNGATLVAHYDMTLGNVQDQSGNGNHGTLVGGTWVDDGTGGGGTPFTATANTKQVITATRNTTANTKQSIKVSRTTTAQTKQQVTALKTSQAEMKQVISKNVITLANTTQEITADNVVVSMAYTKQVVYAERSHDDVNTKQAINIVRAYTAATEQSTGIVKVNTLPTTQNVCMRLVERHSTNQIIKRVATFTHNAKQVISEMVNFVYPARQVIYDGESVIVSRVSMPGNMRKRQTTETSMAGTKRNTAATLRGEV